MILDGSVPHSLQDKHLFALDLPALLSGAKYRGDFEERLKIACRKPQQMEKSFSLLMSCIPLSVQAPQKVPLMLPTSSSRSLQEGDQTDWCHYTGGIPKVY